VNNHGEKCTRFDLPVAGQNKIVLFDKQRIIRNSPMGMCSPHGPTVYSISSLLRSDNTQHVRKKNIIIIAADEFKPDKLSCPGPPREYLILFFRPPVLPTRLFSSFQPRLAWPPGPCAPQANLVFKRRFKSHHIGDE
jgi:hypothetical protein